MTFPQLSWALLFFLHCPNHQLTVTKTSWRLVVPILFPCSRRFLENFLRPGSTDHPLRWFMALAPCWRWSRTSPECVPSYGRTSRLTGLGGALGFGGLKGFGGVDWFFSAYQWTLFCFPTIFEISFVVLVISETTLRGKTLFYLIPARNCTMKMVRVRFGGSDSLEKDPFAQDGGWRCFLLVWKRCCCLPVNRASDELRTPNTKKPPGRVHGEHLVGLPLQGRHAAEAHEGARGLVVCCIDITQCLKSSPQKKQIQKQQKTQQSEEKRKYHKQWQQNTTNGRTTVFWFSKNGTLSPSHAQEPQGISPKKKHLSCWKVGIEMSELTELVIQNLEASNPVQQWSLVGALWGVFFCFAGAFCVGVPLSAAL